MNLSRRSSASSLRASIPPLSSSSSFRRIHPLSRSYSSGTILETEREHDEFRSFDEYSSYDEDEDHTIEETGRWARRYRLGQTSPPASRQRLRQPPPSTRSRNRKNLQISTRTASTGSVGSVFSLEVTIPEGNTGAERSKTPSRLRRPSSHTSFKSSSIVVGGGGRDSSGSSSLESRFSGFSSGGQQDSSNGGNANTPSSTSSTLSTPMPYTPKDILNPSAPPMLSSTKRMSVLNKEKSLPPLPAGGLKKKQSGNLQRLSNGKSSTTVTFTSTTTTGNTLNGTGKYAFPSSRIRTLSCTSTSTPPPSSPTAILSPSSSAVTIKPNVRPLQLPRQTTKRVVGGDRPAVPVPSPTLRSQPQPLPSLRAPTSSFSTLQRHRPSPITPISLGHAGTTSAPTSPAINGVIAGGSGGIAARPKPRTGTGMLYRTSSYGVSGSTMRATMILSGFSTEGDGGDGNGGGSSSFSGPIAI